MADTHLNRRIFHAFPMKPWTVLVQTILFTFLSSQKRPTSPTFSLLPCRDAKFCYVFSASCPVLCCVCSFRAATQGFVQFSLRRVLCGARLRPCLAATQGFMLISLRRVLLWCEIAPLSCRDARFFAVFPASCLMWCGIAPLSCRDAKFLFVFPASCPVVVRDCALVVP